MKVHALEQWEFHVNDELLNIEIHPRLVVLLR